MNDDRPDTQLTDRLSHAVKTVLAPLIAADGGDIGFVGLKDGVAEITLGGACAGCPGQMFTTREVVLPALKAVEASIVSVKVTTSV